MANKKHIYPKTLGQIKAKKLSQPFNNRRVIIFDGKQTSAVYDFIRRHPFLYGVGSLGNISGGYSRFRANLRGSYVKDMRNDWKQVGKAFRESFRSFKLE